MHDPFAVAREMAEARIREHEAAVVHAEGRVSDIERTMAALKQERLAWATVITYEKRLAQQAREFLATLQTAPEPQQLPPPRRAKPGEIPAAIMAFWEADPHWASAEKIVGGLDALNPDSVLKAIRKLHQTGRLQARDHDGILQYMPADVAQAPAETGTEG